MLLVDPEPLFYELGRFLVSSDATPVVYVEATVFTDQYDSVVLVSTDGAETFAANSVPGRGEPLLSLDCHGRLYVLDGTTLYRSHDSGRRWERLAELAPGSSYFSALAGGRTWWTAGVNFIGGDLVVSATGPGALFVSTVGGVYYSDDDGNTWQGMPRLGEYHDGVYADPRGVNLLYSHSPFGGASLWSFVSTDRGASFRDWPVPSVAAPEMPQAIASSAAGELTVVTRHGVYRTNDGGDHFTRLLTLAKPRQVLHAAIGAGDPPAIYAHVSDDDDATTDELVASLDGGRTWAWHDAAISVDDLAIDPQRPKSW